MPALPAHLTLRDSGLVLRDWRREDAVALEPMCGDPDICRFTSVPWHYSLADAEAWIERVRHARGSGALVALAIAEDDAGRPVGNVNLVRFDDDRRSAALGYWLAPDARGRGLASRAAQLLCDWGFAQLGLGRIELAILPENDASQRVAARLGAVCEGIRRDSHEAAGRRWDMLVYALTAQRT